MAVEVAYTVYYSTSGRMQLHILSIRKEELYTCIMITRKDIHMRVFCQSAQEIG